MKEIFNTNNKNVVIVVIVTLLLLVGVIGASYAYFATTSKTSGNDETLNITTEDLGSIKWEGTKVFESSGLLPGECGIQTFTIEKNSTTGKGTYEIDLKGVLDESFGTDIEITLYKSTDTTNDYVSITEGESVIEGDETKKYYKEDTVNTIGNVTKVYGTSPLENKSQIILEQADFDNGTLQKTTYYLVYCYKNNGDQNSQQGKSFSGEISVRLILSKGTDNNTLVDYVTNLAATDTTDLATDDYGNIRYIGADPNNYVYLGDGYEDEYTGTFSGLYNNGVFQMLFDNSIGCKEYVKLLEGETVAENVENENSTIRCVTFSFDSGTDCRNFIKESTSEENITNALNKCTKQLEWRIIGVMKDIDDGTGKKETRIRLIRNESIGSYSWDTSDRSVNYGYGVNEWSQADLMKLLNPGYESETVNGSLYWNSGSGTCYSGNSNSTTSCNFTSTGIKDKLKSLISDAVWNTGSNDGKTYIYNNIITSKFYELERSSNTGKICTSGNYCNDDLERTTEWKGLVGLMYPSDYGYATSGGSTTDRATCLNTVLYSWDDSSVSDCKNNDWLLLSSIQWTMSPYAYSSLADIAFAVGSGGDVSSYVAYGNYGVRPVVYLTSNVGVQSGDGSSSNPFILG